MLVSFKKMLVYIVLLAPLGVHGMGNNSHAIELGKQLIEATKRKDWRTVKKLIVAGADVNQKDSFGMTTLMWAVYHKRTKIIQMLIEAGVDLNQKDYGGKTALISTMYNSDPETACMLIRAGADIAQQDNSGGVLLMHAALLRCPKIVRMLIDVQVDINQKDSRGWTALMFAAGSDANLEAAQMLIEASADLNLKNNEGRSALIWAARQNCPKMIRLLIDVGADVNQQDNDGNTALLHAAGNNRLAICHDIVRGYLVHIVQQEAQQKECIYTLLMCFKRIYPEQYSNLRNIFKPLLQAMIREISQPMYEDINRIKNTAIRDELLTICGEQHNQNKREKHCIIS